RARPFTHVDLEVRHYHVQFVVLVEVRQLDVVHPVTGQVLHRRPEGAVAVAEQHAYAGVVGVGRHQVEGAVAVEVARGHVVREGTDGEVHRGEEAGHGAVLQGFQARAVRTGVAAKHGILLEGRSAGRSPPPARRPDAGAEFTG